MQALSCAEFQELSQYLFNVIDPQLVPLQKLTSNIETDHHRIANVVNFACCYLWTRVIFDTPFIGYNGK